MKIRKSLLTLAAVAMPMAASGQTTYTWNGLAGDGDWENSGNWEGDMIPVDDNGGSGLTMPYDNDIVLSGTVMPTTNVPGYGGSHDGSNSGAESSPMLSLKSGGSLTMDWTSDNTGFWTNITDGFDRMMLTVGDGISGGSEDVTLTMNNGVGRFGRHSNGSHTIRVNSDGTLNMTFALTQWGVSSGRPVFFLIDGGTVNITGVVTGDNYNNGAWEFLSLGGSVTFDKGGFYNSVEDVIADVGTKIVNSAPDTFVNVADNGASLTVSLVQAPDPNYWTGTGGTTWDQATTVNFTTNNKAAALTEDTFANATTVSERATFADEYFSLSIPTAVTQNSITIGTGGVMTSNVDFSADSVVYDVASSDTNGIAGSTAISLSGTAAVTLTGDHATSGNTSIAAGSTLNLGDGTTDASLTNSAIAVNGGVVYNVLGSLTQNGELGGSGTIEKSGAGTVTVTSANGHTGATTLTEGSLAFELNPGSSSFDIASGATLELSPEVFVEASATTLSGAGTLLKTGFETIRWGSSVGVFALDSGALIDVQEGTLRAGSHNNDIWVDNLSDLNVGAGAEFQGWESNIRVDALTGDGDIMTGFTTHNSVYENFTIGVDDGSGTFFGTIRDNTSERFGNLVKEGSGTQTLSGDNTYTGTTTVEAGTLILDGFNSSVRDTTVVDGNLTVGLTGTVSFAPTLDGVTNSIAGTVGTGTVNLNGTMFIDLSNTALGTGNSWTLVNAANLASVSYDPFDFFIDSTIGFFNFEGGGVWSINSGAAKWTFDESTGVLSYSVGSDARLWTGIGGATWDQSTTPNFMDNEPSEPIDNVIFDTALQTSNSVGFADNYFDNGSSEVVATSDITIAVGGVQAARIDFFNSTTPYTVTSSDTIGIGGTTDVSVGGSASLTLIGDHATMGTTTVNSALTLETSGSLASTVTGVGSIEKTGEGIFSLLGTTGHTGSTTVTGGELVLSQMVNNVSPASSTNVIASGAILTYDFDTNGRIAVAGTYSGGGTLRKSGTGDVNWNDATFALESGSVVDVQGGVARGGSSVNEDWTANLSDLNVAAGATFTTVEGNVFVDVLTGDGTIATGHGHSSYQHLTIGVDNGDGSFAGEIIDHGVFTGEAPNHYGGMHKVGTGTQTITGSVALHEDITVEDGSVILDITGSITFFPTTDKTTNVVNGGGAETGSITINGAINFDLTEANTTTGNTWTVLDPTLLGGGVTIGSSATVTSSTMGAFVETVADTTFELDAGGFLWSFDVASATLSVGPGSALAGYDEWLTKYPGMIDTSTGGDEEFDGLVNLLEYVFDGNPTVSDRDNPNLPTVDASGASFVFNFTRLVDSTNDTTQTFQYGSDLTGWADIAVNTDAAPEVAIAAPVGDVETVTVTVAKSAFPDPDSAFGRLDVTQP